MAAMKPRTVTVRRGHKEGRGIVMRVPLEGGGRLVVELSAEEAARLSDALKSVTAELCRLRRGTVAPASGLDRWLTTWPRQAG